MEKNERNVIIVLILVFFIFIGNFIWKGINPPPRGYDHYALSAVQNAYTTAQAYFTDYPDGTFSLSILKEFGKEIGYIQPIDVNIKVLSGGSSNLKITAFHTKGKKIYTVDSRGKISQKRKW